jgi:ACS family hexuronate transporter-like MFS transporter
LTRNLRWWIGGLLFASTIINYIDRQTLSVLAPYLKRENGWSNTDFATILIAFRIAYTIGQGVCGRLIDWMGTRRGLTVSVAFYSTVACLTSLAQGLWGFRAFRFMLGAGESANWPGATKATSEWFPDRERAWAVALFDSGSSIGGAIAPFLVVWLYHTFGTWRPAFVVTGSLGFLWLIAWRMLYRSPEKHPRITKEELAYIQAGRSSKIVDETAGGVPWRKLLRYRQTWGIVIGRGLLDPYWFMVAEWFAIYLVSKGVRVEDSVFGFWAPFLAADLGNFFGGGLSSWFIKRGWSVGKARRIIFIIFGPSMLALIPAAFTSNYVLLVALFAFCTFAYAACSTIFLALPADVFHTRAVASVSGLSGTGAGIGTLISTYLIGRVADLYSFQPIIIAASIVPCIATLVFLTMVRARKQPDPEGIVMQF